MRAKSNVAFFIIIVFGVILVTTSPPMASSHTPFTLKRGHNLIPATPREWLESLSHSELDSKGYRAIVKYIGEFCRTSNTIDLSKYSSQEIYFGCEGELNHVTRKTKVIVLPYITLIKTKEYAAPTIKDRIMDSYGKLYAVSTNYIKKSFLNQLGRNKTL